MAISIDWGTRVIFVPRADMTLVQSTPTEIRELSLNSFRLELKDLEDSEEGIAHPDTHIHNTEVFLGGITFARVIQIINGYTVTFEDGQYAVNLTGANSNVGDVVNVNQVSVRSQNSAGLISSPDIEYSSFGGGVTIDVTSPYNGTTFPVGTPQEPVNNLSDAKLIAEYRGFSTFFIIGDITFDPGDNIDGYIVIGQNPVKTRITLSAGISSIGCEFKEATIDGVLDGNSFIRNCTIENLTYVEGQIRDCVLVGTITLAGNSTTNILGCWDGIAGDGKPTIDMGGSGQPLTVGAYSGELELVNKTGLDKVSIDLLAGAVEIDPSVVAGEIYIRGVGTLVDNSGPDVVVDWSALISREIYDDVYIDTSSSYAGVQYPIGTPKYPVNNVEQAKIIADRLGIRTFSLVGSILLEEAFQGYKFTSPYLSAGTIDINGQDVSGSVFDGMLLNGNAVGPFSSTKCKIMNGMTGIQASLENCTLAGNFVVTAGQAVECDRCNIKGTTTSFDLNGSGQLNMSGMTGVFTVGNMTSPFSLLAATGSFICNLLPSCTNGTVLIAGIGALNNFSSVPNVIDKVIPGAVWDELRSAHTTTGTFGATDEWASAVDVDSIADAVWEEPSDDHTTPGTMGYQQNVGGSGGDPSAIADAVWDEEAADHNIADTMGELQNQIDSLNISKPKIIPGD